MKNELLFNKEDSSRGHEAVNTLGVESRVFKVSRRDVLKAGALLAGGLVFGVSLVHCDSKKEVTYLTPNVYLKIGTDGEVVIIAHRSEMGQGIRTSLPLIVADELGADWSRVKIVQAEGDVKYGDQNTDGSYSVRMFYRPMREAGAAARYLLIQVAAKKWQVPAEECDTENGNVVHNATNRKINFGELVTEASGISVPPGEIKLKERSALKLIGKETAIIDLHDIVTGKAVFGADAEVKGLKVAVIARCPVVGGSVKSFIDDKAKKIPGVVGVYQIKGAGLPATLNKPLAGVAVVADNTWAAIKGRDLLEIEWEFGPNASYDSAKEIIELTQKVSEKGTVRRNRGDFDKARKNAKRVIEHTYIAPHLAHATIEPPTALAIVKNGACEVWACTQNPQSARDVLAEVLEIPKEKITVHVTLLGGGFGRKSKPDFIVEAAWISCESAVDA